MDVPKALEGCDFRLQFTLDDGTVHLGGSALENYNSGRVTEPAAVAAGPRADAPNQSAPDVGSLKAEIDAVLRRDEQYRAHIVSEFGDRGERNSYVHVLREQLSGLREREQKAFSQLESLVRDLESKERRISQLETELGHHRRQTFWRLLRGRFAGKSAGSSP